MGAELDHSAAIPLSEVRLRPVIPNPSKVICVGLNYVAHAEEAGRAVPEDPVLFTKFARSLTGPYDPIPCPTESTAIDYEGELAVVIGEPARRVGRTEALSVVAGCAVANDVSMRDFQNKTHQWLQGKAWDATTPVGPHLVALDEIGDPADLTLRTRVNGETVQAASTSLMIFDVATLVSVISEFTTLELGGRHPHRYAERRRLPARAASAPETRRPRRGRDRRTRPHRQCVRARHRRRPRRLTG